MPALTGNGSAEDFVLMGRDEQRGMRTRQSQEKDEAMEIPNQYETHEAIARITQQSIPYSIIC